jgi:hypothetical protein
MSSRKVFEQKEYKEVTSVESPAEGFRKLFPRSDGWYDKTPEKESKFAMVGQLTTRTGYHFTVPGEIHVASGDQDYINPQFISLPSWLKADAKLCHFRINSGTKVIAAIKCGEFYLDFGDVDTSGMDRDYVNGYNVTGNTQVRSVTRNLKCEVNVPDHGYTDCQIVQFTGDGNPSQWDSIFKDRFFLVTDTTKDTFCLKYIEVGITTTPGCKEFESNAISDGDQLSVIVLSVTGTPKNLTVSVFFDFTF